MAMQMHQMLVWVHTPTQADKRTGFYNLTREQFTALAAQGRAQDPRIGAWKLKPIGKAPPVVQAAEE